MEEKIIEAEIKEKSELIKPMLKHELNAKILSLGKIEDNISEVKDYAVALSEYYKNIVFTPETMKEATDEKAKINKFKDKVAEYRKNIVAEYNKPIKLFETTAKTAEKILTETYTTINNQVLEYQNSLKEEIKEKVKQYFNEYRIKKNIDEKYIDFEELNVVIRLDSITEKGSLTKKIKDEINSKVDAINNELQTIRTMQNSEEILVEYLKHKNLSLAIKEVNDRHCVLDNLKKTEEELLKQQEIEAQTIANVNDVIEGQTTIEEFLEAPVTEQVNEQVVVGIDTGKGESKQVDIYTMKFTVQGTIEQLKAIKEFLEKEGIKYE